jgi:hypothetical protein
MAPEESLKTVDKDQGQQRRGAHFILVANRLGKMQPIRVRMLNYS